MHRCMDVYASSWKGNAGPTTEARPTGSFSLVAGVLLTPAATPGVFLAEGCSNSKSPLFRDFFLAASAHSYASAHVGHSMALRDHRRELLWVQRRVLAVDDAKAAAPKKLLGWADSDSMEGV